MLYVGTSRAQRLLIFAARNDQIDRIARLLEADGVPHTRRSSPYQSLDNLDP